jgi:hypothetical protein
MGAFRTVAVAFGVLAAACASQRPAQRANAPAAGAQVSAETPVASGSAGVQAQGGSYEQQQQQPQATYPAQGQVAQQPATTAQPDVNTERQPVSGRDQTMPQGQGQMDSGAPLIDGLTTIDVQQVVSNAKAENIIDASTMLGADQLQSLLQSLDSNQKASQTASDLTRQLQSRGILGPGERIIGASNGKLYKTSR